MFKRFLEAKVSQLVTAPTVACMLVFVYGFMAWTTWISLTSSTLLPTNEFAGLSQYAFLFDNDRWTVALKNLFLFGGLFIGCSMLLGLTLAILLDQKIRAEGYLRSIFLYPMALSFIVTGTAWKWMLNPGTGLEKLFHDLGWSNFSFDWLIDPNMSIYTVVIAGVWQSSGFVMALFLAGLRGIDGNIVKAAQIDGASTFQLYAKIMLPNLKATFFSVCMILCHIAVKSFDLVMALTGGGPGYSSDLPATFMYTFSFTRNQMGVGSASAVIMLATTLAIIVPYLYSESKGERAQP